MLSRLDLEFFFGMEERGERDEDLIRKNLMGLRGER